MERKIELILKYHQDVNVIHQGFVLVWHVYKTKLAIMHLQRLTFKLDYLIVSDVYDHGISFLYRYVLCWTIMAWDVALAMQIDTKNNCDQFWPGQLLRV